PFAVASPFFRSVPLARYGLEWIEPPAMLAHPFDDGPPAVIYRSIERTAERLERDGSAYRRLLGPLGDPWPAIQASVPRPVGVPAHRLATARFGLRAIGSAERAAGVFTTERARALFAGIAAHGMLPLDRRPSAAFGLVLGALTHIAGWPLPRGGAQRISDALA